MPSAEIITIGTELLLGEIIDTNTRFLAYALRSLGIDLFRTTTIGDNTVRIAQAIREAMERADIIITTGGLGPTVDDPTREAVARATSVETEFREELWEQVKVVVARYGRAPGENQKRQAVVPHGALAIPNPIGTAPCFIMEYPARQEPSGNPGLPPGVIISLPGVPQEMEYIFNHSIIPFLQNHFALREIIKVRILHTSGLGEGMIDEKIGEYEKLINPTVGLAAHSGVVDIRITAKAVNESEADVIIGEVEKTIRGLLGKAIFGVDMENLEQVALGAAADQGWRVAVIESGLDGQLVRMLSAVQPANLSSVESMVLLPGKLPERLKNIQQETGVNAILGVGLFRTDLEQAIEICLITPEAEFSRRLTYGGPPNSAPRWAANMALNRLRLAALGGE
jgi:competence/damage-inducible protein CinA-like protein